MAFLKGLFVILLLTIFGYAKAQEALSKDSVLPDSSNFVTASLIVISPGSEIYSVFGHCALRMECPAEDLDYCYTFESNPSAFGVIQYLTGQTRASFVAVPTKEFFSYYKNEGRQVLQRELSLTRHEKQNLWKILDDEYADVDYRKFNLLNTNCLSMSVLAIEKSLIGEYLDFCDGLPQLKKNNGDLTRYFCRFSPWSEFLYMTIVGNSASGRYETEMRLAPEIIIPLLEKSVLRNVENGSSRTVFASGTVEVSKLTSPVRQSSITPQVVFSVLLLVILAITFGEWKWGWLRIARWTDRVVIFSQVLLGLFLVYITFVSNIFQTNWNWYLIPFNPLYLVLLCRIGKGKKRKILAFVVVVFLLFVAATPFVSQLDWTHQLITISIIVRYLSNLFKQNRV